MSVFHFPKKRFISLAVFLCFYFVISSSFPHASQSQTKTAADLKKEGAELYMSGSYVKAIETFRQIIGLTKEKAILSQAYLYISMSYYCLEEFEEAKKWLDLSLEAVPEIESTGLIFPPGYDNFYKEVKEAKFPKPKPTPVVTETEEGKPVVKVVDQRRGKKKFPILLVVGAVVAVGVVAAVLLLTNKEEEPPQPTTGTIQVNSTPTGAKVFLDGTDTGKTTNCTLTDVSPGSHTVKVSKDGYVDYSGSVSVAVGETATVNATLAKNTISVTSPTGSTVWSKGASVTITWTVGSSSAVQNSELIPSNMMLTALGQQRLLAQRMAADRLSGRSRTPLAGRQGGEASGLSNARAVGRDGFRSEAMDARPLQASVPRQQASAPAMSPGLVAPIPGQAAGQSPRGVAPPNGAEPSPMPLDIAKVKIELFKGTALNTVISAEANNTGSFPWTVPSGQADGTDYNVRISCTTDSSIFGQSPNFTISGTYVNVTYPSSTTVLDRGSTASVSWTYSINLKDERVKIELYKGGSLYSTITSDTGNTGSYSSWAISSTQPEGADYTVKVTTKTSSTSGTSASFIIAEKDHSSTKVRQDLYNPSGVTKVLWYSGGSTKERIAVAERGYNRIRLVSTTDFDNIIYTTSATLPLYQPTGLHYVRVTTPTSHDCLVVADTGYNRVKRYSEYTALNKERSSDMQKPAAIASMSSTGDLYVLNQEVANVVKLSNDLASLLGTYTIGGDLVGLTYNSANQKFYITDKTSGGRRVRAFTTSFTASLDWDLSYEPGGIACSSVGFVYVADRTSKMIRKYSATGTLIASASSPETYLVPTGLYFDTTSSFLYVSFENTSSATAGRVHRYSF